MVAPAKELTDGQAAQREDPASLVEESPAFGDPDHREPLMSFDLVFFGGTGDLTWRKLMPALFQAFRHGKLPPGGRILAVARDEQGDDKYRAWLKERFREVDGAKRPSDEEFEKFAALLHYRRMDLS